jgi:RNA polymerase sigma-70 factor (ECF subfamily)
VLARTDTVRLATTELVERGRAGDVAAFEQLLEERIDRLYRVAVAILGSDSDAWDVVQEASLSAWRQLPRLRDSRAFDAWLGRTLVNGCRMQLRRRSRVREIPFGSDEVRPPAGGGDPDNSDAFAERDAIHRAFARLVAADRALLALHHIERQPVNEIGRFLGIASGTVRWRLHRARRRLERALEVERR